MVSRHRCGVRWERRRANNLDCVWCGKDGGEEPRTLIPLMQVKGTERRRSLLPQFHSRPVRPVDAVRREACLLNTKANLIFGRTSGRLLEIMTIVRNLKKQTLSD